MLTKAAIKSQLIEASKGNTKIVITDKGRIYGSNASESALWMAGGIYWVLPARNIVSALLAEDFNGNHITVNGDHYTSEEFIDLIYDKLEEDK